MSTLFRSYPIEIPSLRYIVVSGIQNRSGAGALTFSESLLSASLMVTTLLVGRAVSRVPPESGDSLDVIVEFTSSRCSPRRTSKGTLPPYADKDECSTLVPLM